MKKRHGALPDMKGKQPHLDTKLIHAGEPKPLIGGAVSMPIFQSSTFAAEGEPGYYNLKYIRLNNTPNHIALHQKPAATENAETALVTASGMAHDFLTEDLPACGISVDFIDGGAPESWESKRRPNTRAIYGQGGCWTVSVV